uniref:Uncharacterized protein n=1 Tax=Amphimedon queenslandica TaxID=400682 RepID=A0A1X7VTS2_AMPQE
MRDIEIFFCNNGYSEEISEISTLVHHNDPCLHEVVILVVINEGLFNTLSKAYHFSEFPQLFPQWGSGNIDEIRRSLSIVACNAIDNILCHAA